MGLVALISGAFRKSDARSAGVGEDGMARVRGGGGASSSGRGGGGGGPAARAEADEPKLPRGMRETAALLRANGYGVLNEEKLRHPHRAEGDAARPSRPQQPQQEQQQQQRTVRLVEPEAAAERRRAADKRKQRDASSSEDERPARSGGAARSTQLQPAPSQGLKRVRSSWKIRPLLVDEKLPVFLEGYDTSLLHYDGGEFHQWLLDCQSGAADPADCFPYPLVVQDRDLRTLLEIKPPGEGGVPGGELAAAVPAAAAAAAGGEGIIVPTVHLLPYAEQPDNLVREQEPPVVQRMQDAEQPDVVGVSAAAQAASAAWRSAERAVALDPPYIRYVQPTPDDLDLAVEYDLDEDDEEWLEQFNAEAKRAKSRKGRRTLGEEWMEHLIDRMEKEYTVELQRHPGKWVMQAADPGGTEPPAISIPSIDEVFPLDKCLQVPGINHYENVIEAVYGYWKAKHERAGRPLIQRLWYEPPWDRKKAAQRLASSAADGEGGASEGGPFYAQDSPAALAGIRKRRMDPEEVKARFQEMRRDLEAARTLADQVRKREKLKRRELQLYKEEWAARMQAIRDGTQRVVLKSGRVKDPPAQLSAVWRMEAYAAELGPEFSDASDEHIAVGAPQDAAAQAEERAARVAQRRYAREAALAPRGQKRPGRPPSAQAQRKPERPRPAPPRPAPARAAAASPILYQGGNVRGPPAGRGIKRVPRCVWCNSDEYHLLGCATCPRCFCFKCFQRRPGLGINNWSRAVKDAGYQCVICRGVEAEDAPSANTADELPAEDAADATSPPRAQQRSRQQQRRSQQTVGDKKVPNNRAEAEAMGIEVPPGLGGAALRSFLRRQWLEEEEAEEGGSSAEEPPVQQAQRQQQAQQLAGSRRRPQQQEQQPSQRQTVGDKQVPNNRAEAEAMGIEVPRGLGGAALRSFLKRLWLEEEEEEEDAEESSEQEDEAAEQEEAPQQPQLARRRQQEQQQQQQQQQAGQRRPQQQTAQPSQRQIVGDKQVPNNRAEAEAMGIEVPRGLGGAALRSFLRRQWLEEEESSSDDEERMPQPGALPSNRAEAEAMGMELPPGLGGAALRSFLLRQQREREEEEGGSGSSQAQEAEEEPRPARQAAPARRRGSSSEGEPEEARPRQRKGGKQRQAAPEPSSSSSSEEEEEEEWPYAFPPPPRKLGGAALRSYIKRQEQLLEEEQEGRQLSGSSSGTALGAGSEGESDAATSGAGASSDEEQSELKENRAPPAKRARKAAAGAPHSRKPAAAAGPAGRRPAAGSRRLQQQNQNRRWSTRHA